MAEQNYDDRTLKVTYKDGDKEVTKEGLCVRWRPDRALLLKTSKSPFGELILTGNIIKVEVIDQTNKLTQTSIKAPTVRDVRRHLLNYHGYMLSEVNKLADEDALGIHDLIHNNGITEIDPDDLGHNHDPK